MRETDDLIGSRRRARLVLLLLLVIGLVADPLSHNHLAASSPAAFSAGEGASLPHPICPVCAVGGNLAVIDQQATFVSLAVFDNSAPAPLLSELAGASPLRSSRAPPLSLS